MVKASTRGAGWLRFVGVALVPLLILAPGLAQEALAPGYVVLGFELMLLGAGAAVACAMFVGGLLWRRSRREVSASRTEVLVLAVVAFFPAWWLCHAGLSLWNASTLSGASTVNCAVSDCSRSHCALTCTFPDQSTTREQLPREAWLQPEGKRFRAQVKRGRAGVWLLDKRSTLAP